MVSVLGEGRVLAFSRRGRDRGVHGDSCCYSGRGCACVCEAMTEVGGAVDQNAVWRSAKCVLSMEARIRQGKTHSWHVLYFPCILSPHNFFFCSSPHSSSATLQTTNTSRTCQSNIQRKAHYPAPLASDVHTLRRHDDTQLSSNLPN
jgi:hypothetical protein